MDRNTQTSERQSSQRRALLATLPAGVRDFVDQAPCGLRAGANPYEAMGDAPTDYSDPTGMDLDPAARVVTEPVENNGNRVVRSVKVDVPASSKDANDALSGTLTIDTARSETITFPDGSGSRKRLGVKMWYEGTNASTVRFIQFYTVTYHSQEKGDDTTSWYWNKMTIEVKNASNEDLTIESSFPDSPKYYFDYSSNKAQTPEYQDGPIGNGRVSPNGKNSWIYDAPTLSEEFAYQAIEKSKKVCPQLVTLTISVKFTTFAVRTTDGKVFGKIEWTDQTTKGFHSPGTERYLFNSISAVNSMDKVFSDMVTQKYPKYKLLK